VLTPRRRLRHPCPRRRDAARLPRGLAALRRLMHWARPRTTRRPSRHHCDVLSCPAVPLYWGCDTGRGVDAVVTGYFGPINSTAAHASELWGPMIRFSLSNATHPSQCNIVETDLTALIDTGSDLSRIDDGLAVKHNLHQLGQMSAVSGGLSSTVNLYSLQITLSDLPRSHLLQLQCPSVQLRSSGAPYDFLLGMDAVRFFELLVVRSRQIVNLRWAG
jgi:hypothetical protein